MGQQILLQYLKDNQDILNKYKNCIRDIINKKIDVNDFKNLLRLSKLILPLQDLEEIKKYFLGDSS